ncbi:MAG TPA: protein translocase subunit SecD [Opitutaceae bacterium]|nr:protein translocase subunit SecD [Opitutaceae bacterium]
MYQRILWKFALTAIVLLWATLNLVPYKETEFKDYLKQEATTQRDELLKLIDRASQRVQEKKAPSVFVALKQLGHEERIDMTKFFPEVRLESSLRNIEKRNDILFEYLLKQSKPRLQLGLDLKGGVAFTLEASSLEATGQHETVHELKLDKAVEIIGTRVNGLGVAEPIIRPVGTNRIEVQLPGVSTKDNPEVISVLKKPALLTFHLVHPQFAFMPEPLPLSALPPGYINMSTDSDDANGRPVTTYCVVKRIPEMDGENIVDSRPTVDMYGGYEILLRFNDVGAKKFADVTGANVGRLLGIVLDGKLYSAPRINDRIGGGSAQITGRFTQREALELSNVLNNPLKVKLDVVEQYEVGKSLGEDAILSAKNAFIISTALTVLFILAFYTYGGLIAAIGMGCNVFVILGVMAMPGLEATLTMPGIAGIVLTLAMSVDANILIFERMKEELATGKSLTAALEAGFEKAWSAILDSNVTTLLVAVIMWALGKGAVKGFGVTLTIGIFTTMFAAMIVSKLLLQVAILPGYMKRLPMFSILQNTKYDFLKFGRPAFITSWLIVLVGLGVVLFKGKDIFGIDFVGGDQVTISFSQPVDVGQLRSAATQGTGVREATFAYQTQLGSGTQVLKCTTEFEKGAVVVDTIQKAFPQAGFTNAGVNSIGPSVGSEILKSAVISVALALVGIMLYVAFRFEFGYGMGAVVSTVHDLFMTIGVFVLFDRQFNASMVAAILLIIGYSINDTIVVFDRIREELAGNPEGSLRDVLNRALNLTLSRTVITGGTTLLTSITLIVVTTGDVNDIAFTLLIGVLTGTFSSLFIACPVFYWWHKGDRRHVEAHRDIAPKYEWEGASKASN